MPAAVSFSCDDNSGCECKCRYKSKSDAEFAAYQEAGFSDSAAAEVRNITQHDNMTRPATNAQRKQSKSDLCDRQAGIMLPVFIVRFLSLSLVGDSFPLTGLL
jgi:hypothetical protein